MKKMILAAVAAATVSMGANAQNYLVNNPSNQPYWGARVGLDISSTGGNNTDIYGNGAGFTAGAVYNIPVYMNMYFEPGLSIFYDTFDQTLIEQGRDNMPVELDGSIRNFGFRVPLNLGYRFDFTDDTSVYLFTGPVFNLSLTARDCVDGLPGTSAIGHGFKRADLQWDFGAAVSWNNYYVSVSGGAGITRVYSNYDDHFRRNTFNISLGYNF